MDPYTQVLQLNQIVSICLQETVLPWNTKYLYKWRSPYVLSVACKWCVLWKSSAFIFMSISCLRHWLLHLSQLHSTSWMFQHGCLYCHLSKTLLPDSLMREQMSLKVRRQTSSLVFIFIFYISLNVQLVSCSIVSLYTYVSILVDLFGSTYFFHQVVHQSLNAVTMLFLLTNCHLFIHSFNNVLRILFAKNELSLLVPLYTYLYLNKTISDKELACVNPKN